MAKLATAEFQGINGKYSFNVYSWDTSFKPLGAVYCFSKRTVNPQGLGEHDILYVGITNDLSVRFNDHHKEGCAEKNGANCICIYQEDSEEARKQIEKDLISKHKPKCNEQLK